MTTTRTADLNAGGNNNDRYIDPATGKQVSLNAGRGDNTFVFDMRSNGGGLVEEAQLIQANLLVHLQYLDDALDGQSQAGRGNPALET